MANIRRLIKNAGYRKSFNDIKYRKKQLNRCFRVYYYSKIRKFTNICLMTGMAHSVYQFTGLRRHQFRKYARQGDIAGIRNSSW